jgi:hypothetical protein
MSNIDELIVRIRGLEEEMQAEFDKKRDDFRFVIDKRRARFSEDVTQLQRISKVGLVRYVTGASLLSLIVAPVIYSGVVAFLLLDLFLLVYQAVCFPIYQITKVKRAEYVVFDRGDLPYLNAVEKLNCAYCGYANGLMGFAREIAARTEQYFCPIKHARRIRAAHGHYSNFFEYGDAESYRRGLMRLRENLAAAAEIDE